MDDGAFVTFVELGGPDAAATLDRLRARLASAGAPSRLLVSRDEADLHLLVVDGDPPLEGDETRGARVWRFREAQRPAASARGRSA
ncbi:MAG: hypothetical protein GVY27_00895 [Deinococcus-Thermus bacterium]|jgi:hypothetical protein|nr:hypothetical protein [Deinococcota bacterium]